METESRSQPAIRAAYEVATNLGLSFERAIVLQHRTAIDYAHQLRAIVDDFISPSTPNTLVQENLNTHSPASLYKAFEPEEARRILEL